MRCVTSDFPSDIDIESEVKQNKDAIEEADDSSPSEEEREMSAPSILEMKVADNVLNTLPSIHGKYGQRKLEFFLIVD